jgi:hypothetical protein
MLIEANRKQAPFASYLSSLFCCALALLLFAAGCATPIGVVRGTTQQTYYALTANVLSAGEPSSWSKQVLHRNNLTEQFEDDPGAALAELHQRLKERTTSDRLFALAELSFFHAEQSGKREYYLAAAAYAYAFLLPEREDMMIRPIGPAGSVGRGPLQLGNKPGAGIGRR